MNNSLSITEQNSLHSLETRIAAGLQHFLEVGNALLEIQRNKLYREGFQTFETYLKGKWHLSKQSGYQLMAAAKVVENLAEVSEVLPVKEAQARPLAHLPKQAQQAIWKDVVATAKNTEQPITAKLVAEKISASAENKLVPPSPIGEGLGHGKVHKISVAERIQQEESIAELRQRPTMLEYQILLGELEQMRNAQPSKHRYLTGNLLAELIARTCRNGQTYTNKASLISDVANEMRNQHISTISQANLISLVNDYLLRHEYPKFEHKPDGSLVFQVNDSEAQYFMFSPLSTDALGQIVQAYFPVLVDASEDQYMYDLCVYKKARENFYVAFGTKRYVGHIYLSAFTSNSKANDLSGDYLHHSVRLTSKSLPELHAVLAAIGIS